MVRLIHRRLAIGPPLAVARPSQRGRAVSKLLAWAGLTDKK